MAYTYPNTPVLSRIQIGEDTYYLKDADVRAVINGFNEAIVKGTIGAIDGQNNLVYSQDIKAYVDSAVAVGLKIVVVDQLPTASADTMGKLYLTAQSGGKTGDFYNEYITVQKEEEGSTVYVWELIGDTRIDLSGYLTSISYVDATHKLQQTKGGIATDVHEFGDLADADTASATYTPAGSVSKPDVDVTPTTATVAVKNADGSVTAGAAASFTEGAFTPNVPTALDLTKFNGGSKAADTFDEGALPSKAADSFSAGALPSYTEGQFSAGVLPSFTIGGADSETLIFNPGTLPSKDADTFNAGSLPSFTEGAFDAGSLPSFTEGAFTAASLAEGFYTAGSAASKAKDTFTANTPTAVTLPTFENATVVTGVSAELHEAPAFTGTEATITVNPDEE